MRMFDPPRDLDGNDSHRPCGHGDRQVHNYPPYGRVCERGGGSALVVSAASPQACLVRLQTPLGNGIPLLWYAGSRQEGDLD
jgi:hypothetical protein